MFPSAYFALRYFPRRYWPRPSGTTAAPIGSIHEENFEGHGPALDGFSTTGPALSGVTSRGARIAQVESI